MHTFHTGDQVKFRHTSEPFQVLAVTPDGLLTISRGFGRTVCEVPPHVLEPAEAKVVGLARLVA